MKLLLLSIACDDKPGVVEKIATIVKSHEGNWQESQLSHLGGKFTGLVIISIPEARTSELQTDLAALDAQDIYVECHPIENNLSSSESSEVRFHASGPDAPGILLELTQAFRELGVNVERLDTEITSMAYSGNPLFTAKGALSMPSTVTLQVLEDNLLQISDALALDIQIDAR